MKKLLKEQSGRIFESKTDDKGKVSYPVVIIGQGMGNLADKNYYTAEFVESAAPVYEGKKAYYDHPTQTQEKEQPGRSVKEICGHYENCKAVKNSDGLMELRADFVPMKSKSDVIDLIEHSIEYKKKHKDSDFVGISINADGAGESMSYDDFISKVKPSKVEMEKIKQVEGQEINVVHQITDAQSADIVTEAGARGKFTEAYKNKKKRRTTMFEAMRKFLSGAEAGDKKLMEEASKELGAESEDEAKKKEDEAKHAEKAGKMAKALAAVKKEMKKEDGESEEAYEAKCMAKAMKQSEDEKSEDEKKEDEAKAKQKAEDEAKAKKEADDAAAKDKDADKDAGSDMDKMKKEMESMKKEIEALKKEKKESEDEAKKHHEESAKNKIALDTKERKEQVDRLLKESGLPRYATKPLAELFLSKAHKKEEMEKLIETAKNVHSKAIESALMEGTSGAFVEKTTTESDKGSNDHLLM